MHGIKVFFKKLVSSLLIFFIIQGFLWVQNPIQNTVIDSNIVFAKGEKGKLRPGIKSQTGAKMRSVSKNIREDTIIGVDVELSSGTVVSEKGGDITTVETFLSNPNSVVSLKDEVFKLGYDNKYLTFSKPVKLTFATQFKKGTKVRPLVQHFGDEKYNTVGLTTNPSALCEDGKVVNGTFDTVTVGKKGIVEFYTCGASRFIMNPGGGTTTSNDLKVLVGDCGQVQIYYKGFQNIYVNDPPATGCTGTPSAWLRLRVGTNNIGNGGSAWTTMGNTGVTNGNTYTATSSMTKVIGGLTYTLNIYRSYTSPNTSFTWRYNLNIPAGNTQNVKLYYGQDSYVAGADANDVGYFSTGPTITAGIYDNVAQILSAMRYLTGQTWAGYEAAGYSTISSRITSGANFNNTIQGTPGDLGYGINWDFGTGTTGNYTSTTEWRMAPYVATNVPDLVASVGQPTPNMQVNVLSQLPLIVTNVGNTGSTGSHTLKMTLPTQVTGPSTTFSSNGWSCSATVSQIVTCTKTTIIGALGTGGVNIPVIPQAAASGMYLPFTGNITNTSDSNQTNNTGVTVIYVQVAPAPTDTTPPVISYNTPLSGSIRPIGAFTMSINHSDSQTALNLASPNITLQKWSGASWGTNIATGIVDFAGKVINNSGASYTMSGMTFGKYQVTYTIKDMAGNTGTGISIFYIDEPEINISTGSLNMGVIPYNINTFTAGEIIVTIKTVGVGFTLHLNQNTEFGEISGQTIPRWNGTQGFGYQPSPYAGNILTIATGGTLLLTQAQNINTNGLKNTYTFTLKPGAKFTNQWQVAGDYSSNIGFTTQFNY